MAAFAMVLLFLAVFKQTVIYGIPTVPSSITEYNLHITDDNVPSANDDPAGSSDVAEGIDSPTLDSRIGDTSPSSFSNPFEENFELIDKFHQAQVSATGDVNEDNVEGFCTSVVMLTEEANAHVMVVDKLSKVMLSSNQDADSDFLGKLFQVIISSPNDKHVTDIRVTFDQSTGQISTSDPLFYSLPTSAMKAITHFFEDVKNVQTDAFEKAFDFQSDDIYIGAYGCGTNCFYKLSCDFGSEHGAEHINVFSIFHFLLISCVMICITFTILCFTFMCFGNHDVAQHENNNVSSDPDFLEKISNYFCCKGITSGDKKKLHEEEEST